MRRVVTMPKNVWSAEFDSFTHLGVNGHLKFPMGGQEKSPDTVIDLPGYGHQIPHVAMV